MKNFSIKIKLIIIFILIKIIPLLIITYISYEGILKLDKYLNTNVKYLFNQSKEIIIRTADASINDSIKNLDKKSQLTMERISYEIANNLADFLYQRDEDITFLSKLDLNQKILENFYESKNRNIITHGKYKYDEKSSLWISNEKIQSTKREEFEILDDNKRNFNFTDPQNLKLKKIPIYKEVVYFDLKGNEIYKVSSINKKLLNISIKTNTYINSEEYFNKIKTLEKDNIYVSNVIGEYVPSKIIGSFTKEKAKKSNINFEPQKSAYAGTENPLGKKFEAIIRYIKPIYKDNKKIGYISLALDHEHVMQFTDTSNPTSSNIKQNISDASKGNYAFMWDNEGRNISHPRDYFIVGYDSSTGKPQMPWLSAKTNKEFEASNQNINEFLNNYKTFDNQSLKEKPNIKQLKEKGYVGLDCRYLNFAPQCQGWMQVTQNGGYGSFLIYWSNVWKLTTAATIPYYTGQYANSKRGFGFITIGANVEEFHAAANKTKVDVNKILEEQSNKMKMIINDNELQIEKVIMSLLNELTIVTILMLLIIIVIALWLSSYISKKIEKLLIGTTQFANNDLDYRIKITSQDEIGKLEKSFNTMAIKIQTLLEKEKKLNESLEQKVETEIKKQREQEQILIQQSRFASMGEMIGNIAHQWRQPLNALGLVIQNIQVSYKMGDLDEKFLDNSVKKANLLTSSMSNTIDDFRSFFKTNKIIEQFDLHDSIEDSLELIESTYNYHEIKLVKNYLDKHIIINGYKNEFSQALLNLLNNAKDALSNIDLENKEVVISLYIENNNAIIDISDNAGGIPALVIDKIFDPYFTTKEEGKGTGIGLYMSKVIIENNMNAKLIAKNENKGALFKIIIPIQDNAENKN
ncbi:sensor histidine kinase [Poseidonibacter lekithochrous]|uniref:sensor histidine kinase n=1 Tax=Poseidonibacter lekithochrous TaxID=1904463 RepID=UPI000D353746|nr:ATP-binding protein [Poseidonibacter lekithochrous]